MSESLPLKPLHGVETLSAVKISFFGSWSSDKLKESLALGQEHCLKARADGTMLDGHHRVHVLRARNEDVDLLPREILSR